MPEYNLGAMENPGLVTFTESYVFTSRATDAQYQARANTLLHEMAHMWFGDLVTMQWWDDLWLKESFADYMGTLGVDRTTDWDTAWVNFANNRKAWAYVQDQLPTTHPIVADIPDLEAAKQNFDGITYAKGASVLKQLVAYVGFEAFIAGSRQYFRDHAYGNTTLADLLGALSAASGRDLAEWARQWLQTSGISTLSSEITLTSEIAGHGDTLSSVAILQDAVDPVTGRQEPRPHRLRIGLYDFDDAGALVRTDSVETDRQRRPHRGDRRWPENRGPRCCWSTMTTSATPRSGWTRTPKPPCAAPWTELRDPMARALCWTALWDSARDAVTPASLYVDAVQRSGRPKPESASCSTCSATPRRRSNATWPGASATPCAAASSPPRRNSCGRQHPGSDQQLAWARTLAATSRYDASQLDLAPRHPGRQHRDRRPCGGRRTALELLARPGRPRPGLPGRSWTRSWPGTTPRQGSPGTPRPSLPGRWRRSRLRPGRPPSTARGCPTSS